MTDEHGDMTLRMLQAAEEADAALSGKDPELARSFLKDFVVHVRGNAVVPDDTLDYLARALETILALGPEADANKCLGIGQTGGGRPRKKFDSRFDDFKLAQDVAFNICMDGLGVNDAIAAVAQRIQKESGQDKEPYVRAAWNKYRDRFADLVTDE